MIESARILSKNIPLVRIDFYEVEGKLYFGEMTMTPAGGCQDFLTKEALIEMKDIFYEK